MVYQDVHIKMFPAGSGDCFLIEFAKEDFRVLMDGGYAKTYYKYLRPCIRQLHQEGKRIDLMILSHIDQDHINGIKALLKENGEAGSPNIIRIGEVWFNGFRHTEIARENAEIPYYEKSLLQTMANQAAPDQEDGRHDISYTQGESVASLLTANGYHWNTSVEGGAVCVDTAERICFGEIEFQILNPTQKTLNLLAEKWIESLKAKCKPVVIGNNHLFDAAFEGAYIREQEEWVRVVRDISLHDTREAYDWDALARMEDPAVDTSVSNCSSIAVLINYKGRTFLFPGDCAVSYFKERLPKAVNVVKLPHHGSGKNTDQAFIRSTEVSCYLLSTDGRHTGHPSPGVIANILTKSNGRLIKNYDIPMLREIGELEDAPEV